MSMIRQILAPYSHNGGPFASHCIVCESFQAISHGAKPVPLEVIGYLKAFSDLFPFHWLDQPPAERLFAKSRWPDLKFPKLGKHEVDAFMHGLTANVKLFGRDEFQFIDCRFLPLEDGT